MRKASELYELSRREVLLLELFNHMDDTEQIQKLCGLAGYLVGRGIISTEKSLEYMQEIKKD